MKKLVQNKNRLIYLLGLGEILVGALRTFVTSLSDNLVEFPLEYELAPEAPPPNGPPIGSSISSIFLMYAVLTRLFVLPIREDDDGVDQSCWVDVDLLRLSRSC